MEDFLQAKINLMQSLWCLSEKAYQMGMYDQERMLGAAANIVENSFCSGCSVEDLLIVAIDVDHSWF
jgi:hypothetical protein